MVVDAVRCEVVSGVVSDERDLVYECHELRDPDRVQLTPFAERYGAGLLKNGLVIQGAILVEVVEHGRMDRGEFLQASHLVKSRAVTRKLSPRFAEPQRMQA